MSGLLQLRPARLLARSARLALLSVLLIGCSAQSSPNASLPTPSVDTAYLTGDLWNDGQAEVAFYDVTRTRDQYGRSREQTFTVGTYLVKHRFSPDAMTKVTDGGGVSAFKSALFYEFNSGAYQYKRNWVVNARQRDLQPIKQSFTSFDWCSNRYEELAFAPEGPVEVRMRSDDYGNARRSVNAEGAYPPAQVPLLVRGLDVSQGAQSFAVVTVDGTTTRATARSGGRDTVERPAGSFEAERIHIAYDAPVPSPIGEASDTTETYWRLPDGDRRLVKWEAGSGRYRAVLVEHLRSPYWQENFWPLLERVASRP